MPRGPPVRRSGAFRQGDFTVAGADISAIDIKIRSNCAMNLDQADSGRQTVNRQKPYKTRRPTQFGQILAQIGRPEPTLERN